MEMLYFIGDLKFIRGEKYGIFKYNFFILLFTNSIRNLLHSSKQIKKHYAIDFFFSILRIWRTKIYCSYDNFNFGYIYFWNINGEI